MVQAVSSGSAAPAVKVPAEASAAWSGRALTVSVIPIPVMPSRALTFAARTDVMFAIQPK